jgi:HEAT repeat protein
MGLFGRPNVERLDRRGDLDGLVRAARYKKDVAVRAAAAEALAGMTDLLITTLQSFNLRHVRAARAGLLAAGRPAIDAMLFVITDRQSPHRRQDVTFVLGEARATAAVDMLIGELRDHDALLRALAADALGKIGDRRAEKPLRIALRDSEEPVRKAVEKALTRLDG